MAECLTVDQDVAGSTPVSHPLFLTFRMSWVCPEGYFTISTNPTLTIFGTEPLMGTNPIAFGNPTD